MAAFGLMLVGGADFAVPYLAVLPTCSVCGCGGGGGGLLCFPSNIFSLTRHMNDVILSYVFFVENPLRRLVASFSSVLFSTSFFLLCCLSFFFYLKKT